MGEFAAAGRDDSNGLVRYLAGRYDVPAYVRRARRVQEALDLLVQRCLHRRDEWLDMVRLRLKMFVALAGPEEVEKVRPLANHLGTSLPSLVPPTPSRRRLRRAGRELAESLDRFNRRWTSYLEQVDLAEVNRLRAAYNRYYLVEKECALRSPRLARHGFQPLNALTHADLIELLPALPDFPAQTLADM
jgi:hypothetical protein